MSRERSCRVEVEDTGSILLLVLPILAAMLLVGCLQVPEASCSFYPSFYVNHTDVHKPVEAVTIDPGQIPVGSYWTYTYNLERGLKYHVYLLGAWANPATHKTDYDIFVYDPAKRFVSSHTESAGLPEQVGNDGFMRYFTPPATGDYTFCIRNDNLESKDAEAGTLMVVEHIEPNTWYSRWMQGKVGEEPVTDTTWAYEFNTTARRIRVSVIVPDGLDMYEVRIYAMATPSSKKGDTLNGIPIAWEPGLRGEVSGEVGGFNFDSEGYRNVNAMASCEHSGEDMTIDYAPTAKDNMLYHLVLIAEYNSGTIDFIVQTDFDPPSLGLLDPPELVYAGDEALLEVNASDATEIELELSYSNNGGSTWEYVDTLGLGNGTYGGYIPSHNGGTSVDYVFRAVDEMDLASEVSGSYSVLNRSRLNLFVNNTVVYGGENVSIHGDFNRVGSEVDIIYSLGDSNRSFSVTTDELGLFQHAFAPSAKGNWRVYAEFAGDGVFEPTKSDTMNFTVRGTSTVLSCYPDRETIVIEEAVTLNGQLSPAISGASIILSLTDGQSVNQTATTTAADGSYAATFRPNNPGDWQIVARYNGNLRFEASDSGVIGLKVNEPDMLLQMYRILSPLLKPPYLYAIIAGPVGIAAVILVRRRGHAPPPEKVKPSL